MLYKKIDASDKKYKPLILKWLSSLFEYKDYPHSFKDQWIIWNIWNSELTVSFDLRQEEHLKLLSLIPCQFLGCAQYKTLKIVNEKTFYLRIEKLLHIEYPNIVRSSLLNRQTHKDNDGDTFYTYNWEVFLTDQSSIFYHNQKETMDMIKGDFIYNSTIQERAFTNFLESIL